MERIGDCTETSRQPIRKTPGKLLIERIWDPKKRKYVATIDDSLGTELTRAAVLEQTPQNRLMLGKLGSLNNEVARRIIEWFEEDLEFYDMHRNPGSEAMLVSESARLLKENEPFARMVARLMKDADTGIQEVGVVDEKTFETISAESEQKLEVKEHIKPGLSFRHATEDGTKISFRTRKESSGTLRFIALLVAILQPSARRRLICIDEFEREHASRSGSSLASHRP